MLPIPNIPLPFPTPPLSESLTMVLLTVAGIGGFFGGFATFVRFADPPEFDHRTLFRYFAEYAMPTAMFAVDYAAGDLSGILFWAGMLVFEAVRLRLGLSMRAVIALVIATVRRIIREIRKRLP